MDINFQNYDLREFLERFSLLLQKQDAETETELAEKLAEYGRLCIYANKRLRECFALSQRGQYANAIALSEQQPNLLEWCTQLPIPEAPILPKVAEVLKVSPPTPLDLSLVDALQEAYQKGNTAAGNMRQLHRLTLARAPLPTRLAVMRRLYLQDSNHPFLDNDIRAFERAWYKQAADYVKPYTKLGNPDLIREVIRDIEEGGYLEIPPSNLISHLNAQVAKAEAVQLPLLAGEIKRAYASRSFLSMVQLGERWRVATEAVGEHGADETYGVTDALVWLSEALEKEQVAQERQAAQNELRDWIHDPGATVIDLESAFEKVKSLGGVDADMTEQFFARLDGLNRRRMFLRAGKIAAATAGILPIAAFVILLFSGTGGGMPEKEDGKAAFAKALKEIENTPPDGDIQPKVATALKLAFSPESRQDLERYERAWKLKHEVLEVELRKAFDDGAAGLKKKAESHLADARGGRSGAAVRESVEGLRNEIVNHRSRPGRSHAGESDLAAAETTLAAMEAWAILNDELASLRKELAGTNASRNVLQRLARFLDETIPPRFPDRELAEHARLAMGALPTWMKILEFQEELQSGPFPVGTEDVERWSGQPPAAVLTALRQLMAMSRARDPSDREGDAYKLKQRLADRDIVGLWSVHQTGALPPFTYYTTKSQAAGKVDKELVVLLNREGRVSRVPIDPTKWRAAVAPQSEFAEKSNKLWQSSGSGPWVETLAEVYDSLLDSREMDPLLKLHLARKFLTLAVKTSHGYQTLLEGQPEFAKITGIGALIEGNWLDPGQDLQSARERAEDFLEKSPRLTRLAAEAAARDDRWGKALRQGVVVVGWVARDDRGRPAVEPFVAGFPAAEGRIYAVAGGRWILLGEVSVGTKKWSLNESAEKYVGWPVFAVMVSP